jgi:ABC-type uncharacterized transport system substrate-binding protein
MAHGFGLALKKHRMLYYNTMTALARTILRSLSFFLVAGGAGLFILCLSSAPARAHPHAWIDVQSEILFDGQGRVTGLRQTWVFDEFYTEFALQDFGVAQQGVVDTSKLVKLGKENLENLKTFGYFTFMDAGQTRLNFSGYRDITSDLKENRIRLSFTLTLEKPIHPQKQTISYRIYDPSYYIEMKHIKDGVRMSGPSSCHATLERPKPDVAVIAMAGALDKNAKAPEDLGRFFAERVDLHCKAS